MKWGTGITLTLASFMGFILFMVVMAFQQSTDLTSEDYYEQELAFESRIQSKLNSSKTGAELETSIADGVLSVVVKNTGKLEGGEIRFYRPDNQKLDLVFDLTAPQFHIDVDQLVSGNYELEVEWTSEEKPYYLHKDLLVVK